MENDYSNGRCSKVNCTSNNCDHSDHSNEGFIQDNNLIFTETISTKLRSQPGQESVIYSIWSRCMKYLLAEDWNSYSVNFISLRSSSSEQIVIDFLDQLMSLTSSSVTTGTSFAKNTRAAPLNFWGDTAPYWLNSWHKLSYVAVILISFQHTMLILAEYSVNNTTTHNPSSWPPGVGQSASGDITGYFSTSCPVKTLSLMSKHNICTVGMHLFS